MISGEHIFDVTTAPKRDSRHWSSGQVTWGELKEWMQQPANTKACGNYVLGRFLKTTVTHPAKPGQDPLPPCTNLHRTKMAIELRGALTLDVDHAKEDFLQKVRQELGGISYIIHTTYSSTPEEPRYRLIVPLDRTVTPDEYHVAAASIMQGIGVENFDPGSVQPERYMFRPSEAKRGAFWYDVNESGLADVEQLLQDFEEDLSSVPLPKPSRSKRDPFAIEGTVGAFNRAYENLQELIQVYDLPYEEAGVGRWHLAGAAAAAGMGEVAPGLYFSHHANDPAYGQTCSAFDMARLHLFGDLDENSKPGTPINKLPSTIAMQEMATTDVNVLKELVGNDFADDMEATADAITQDSWQLGLQRHPRTGEPIDNIVNWDLIGANDPVFSGLFYNEMSLALETDRDLPWRKVEKGKEAFNSGDRSSLALYIERTYSIRPPRAYMDDVVNDRARHRVRNPVRDYLESLRWDGKSRIETALPGVRPTEFTRLAARKALVAAAARMLEPGIKWDHTLVLFGSEGLGKSYWIDKMSKGYSSSLGRLNDKDTLIVMQRSWIMTADEGHSLRKADFDAQKEFLTKTHDIFRMPYEREASIHPRHCVIWSTTNDEVFLRRQEGNRRFHIVKCEDKVDFSLLTDEYIDQVWAEAVHLFRNGELLFLSDDESDLAAEEREQFTEEDALAGVITEYLDTKVPENWNDMSPSERQMWLQNRADGFAAEGTEDIDEVCSLQVYIEALGRRMGDQKRMELLEITNVLKALPGWTQMPGRHRLHGYGPQLVFRRISSLEGSDLI